MDRGKRGKKKKIKKTIPKIRFKQKKNSIVSKNKTQTQTQGNGLFQPFFKAFENFKKKQKVESYKQIKFAGKERERQIQEEQRKLKEDEKKLQEQEDQRLKEVRFVGIEREKQITEEQQEREKLDPIYKEKIAKVEQEKLVQLAVVSKLKEKEYKTNNKHGKD